MVVRETSTSLRKTARENERAPVTNGTSKNATQDVATAFVRRDDSVRNRETESVRM